MKARSIFIALILLVLLTAAGCASAPAATQSPYEARPTRAAGSQWQEPATEFPLAAPTSAALNPYNNEYQDYGVNPQENPDWDNLSTFAVDVDTASYTVARRYLEGGSLPPYDAVRAEEFINYFDYQYPSPEEGLFAIYTDGAPSPFGDQNEILLRFGIQAYRVPDEERQPAALTFVIDVSGSMDMDNRLGLVEQALTMLVDNLQPEDTVSIVVYGSRARVALEPTGLEDRRRILRVIDNLQTEGSTNAEDGLKTGYSGCLPLQPAGHQPGHPVLRRGRQRGRH